MSEQYFLKLAQQQCNRVPVSRRILADTETPVSAYIKLANAPYSYLLESVQGGEKWGRYSIIGLPCEKVIRIKANTIRIESNGQLVEQHECSEPLQFIRDYQQQYQVAKDSNLPPFFGGLVGSFAYDTVRYVEPDLAATQLNDPLNSDDILLMVSEEVLVFDNLRGVIELIVLADPSQSNAYQLAQQRLDQIEQKLTQQTVALPTANLQADSASLLAETAFESGFKQPEFEQAIETIQQAIAAGEVSQVVISQRLSIDFDAQPLELYRALRYLNPSPYMYYLHLDDTFVVGSSPEILARVDNQQVTVKPIAGTRPRGKTAEEDSALEQELLADPKEVAEHEMLIELGCNDIAKVVDKDSIEVTDRMIIERYSHVMHIVSNVTGDLLNEKDALDALKATLPAGTLSGAPKLRAMQIIDELEPVKRGIYGGAIGYLSWNGNMDTAIAIRTAVIKDKRLHIQAGAGIVADSVPEKEWQETMNKARAIFRAVAMVQR